MSEPDNLVLAHLRELRAIIEGIRSGVDRIEPRLDSIEQRLGRVEERIDIMHLNGVKALKQFVGHRAMVERGVGSLVDDFTLAQKDIEAPKGRVARLEDAHA